MLRGFFPKVFDSDGNEAAIQQGKPISVGTFFSEEAAILLAEIEQLAPEISVNT
jgi:hypothetical protein